MKRYFNIFLVASILLTSCNNEGKYSEHSSGLNYRFFETNPQGESPKNGDIVVLSLKYYTTDNKLIDASDFYRMQVGNPIYQGDFYTGLQMLQVGDSASFRLDASNFYERTRKTDLPKELKQGDEVVIYLRLKNIISAETLVSERRSMYHTDQQQEQSLLEAYLERANITEKPTASGLYIIQLKEGTGQYPVNGNHLTVHYTGKTIDGKVFDTSLDKAEPMKFTLGVTDMIPGWEEGIRQVKKGGKVRLIVPSALAYGKNGYQNIILPYSTLIFDIELIDIK